MIRAQVSRIQIVSGRLKDWHHIAPGQDRSDIFLSATVTFWL